MNRCYERNGVKVSEDMPDPGYVVVDTYHPCSSVTPWDGYGLSHQRQYLRALKNAGIDGVPLRTVETKLYPMGSGPRGSVRFGDAMMPGVYRIAVKESDANRAIVVLGQHEQAVHDWANGDIHAPMPAACYE